MYVEGTVCALDEANLKIKLQLADYDDFVTEWLSVPQLFCVGDKARKSLPEINSLCAAILSDDMSHGAVLGALYNDEDTIPEDINSENFIQYSDGTSISHNEDEGGFLIVKNLKVLGDIEASGDIKDKKGTMQGMRDIYNKHSHSNGNMGAPTGSPSREMQ